ncbi:LysR family transcriptional regulator [Vibrio sp. FNV 38]|nr:LysR family transcriptional regulator [Vibrio sp. FNV 38]
MNFSIEQLLAFVTVYEEKSFSQAAAKLNKHRTTTGQVIANLEDLLAIKLFKRVGRTVEPTEDGDLLYHYAKSALEQTRLLDKVALSLSFSGLEKITIAYPSYFPDRLLSDIRIQLAKDFPHLSVNLVVRSKEEVRAGMESGEFHFGFVNALNLKAMHSMDSTLIGSIEFVPFTRKNSALALCERREIMTQLKASRQFILRSFVEEGVQDKMIVSAIYEEVDQLAMVIKLVQEGVGWAWLPKVLNEAEYITDGLVPLDIEELQEGWKFQLVLWSPHSKPIGKIKQSLLDVINQYAYQYKRLQTGKSFQ